MPDPKINVAFIGTGLMGLPMVKNLSKGGYKIKAFNRTLSKMDELKNNNNIIICSSLNEAITDATVIITSLPDDDSVEKIINEIINKDLLNQESIFIDTSSTEYKSAKKFYNILKEKKINFLDAPISGGPEGAKSASLAIMVGGDNEIFDRVKDILKTMGNPTLVGPAGSGQVAKLCNQIIVGVTIGAVATLSLIHI